MVQAQNLPCSLRPWKAARSGLQDKSQLKKQDTTTTTKAEAGSRSATRTHNCTMKMLKIAVKCIFIHKNNLAALESLSVPRIYWSQNSEPLWDVQGFQVSVKFQLFWCLYSFERVLWLSAMHKRPKAQQVSARRLSPPRVQGVTFTKNPPQTAQSHQSVCQGPFMLYYIMALSPASSPRFKQQLKVFAQKTSKTCFLLNF